MSALILHPVELCRLFWWGELHQSQGQDQGVIKWRLAPMGVGTCLREAGSLMLKGTKKAGKKFCTITGWKSMTRIVGESVSSWWGNLRRNFSEDNPKDWKTARDQAAQRYQFGDFGWPVTGCGGLVLCALMIFFRALILVFVGLIFLPFGFLLALLAFVCYAMWFLLHFPVAILIVCFGCIFSLFGLFLGLVSTFPTRESVICCSLISISRISEDPVLN